MKIKRILFTVLAAIAVAAFALPFFGCNGYSDISGIPRNGKYCFISTDYITKDGSVISLRRNLNRATERFSGKNKIYSHWNALEMSDDKVYFGYVFYYGDDKTYFDMAVGSISLGAFGGTTVYGIVKDVRDYQTISLYGESGIVYMRKGNIEVFDIKKREASRFVFPQEFENSEIRYWGGNLDGYFAVDFEGENGGADKVYISDGGGYEKTIELDNGEYLKTIKNGCLLLKNGESGEIISGINIDGEERLSAEQAAALYESDRNVFTCGGKKYTYSLNHESENTVLTVSEEGGASVSFTAGSLEQSVPEVRQANGMYSTNRSYLGQAIVADGELFVTIVNQPGMFGYSKITPTLVLKYVPENSSFAYVGFHPDYEHSIKDIIRLK